MKVGGIPKRCTGYECYGVQRELMLGGVVAIPAGYDVALYGEKRS